MSPLSKICAAARCYELVAIGRRYCAQHARRDSTKRNQRTRRDGRQTSQWRNHVRLFILERDAHTCTRCGAPGTHAHSLHGGYHSADPSEYQTLCASCHGQVHGGRRPAPGAASDRSPVATAPSSWVVG
jgi:5-methylcytosine-specific restriction endonuclease McrA